MFATRDQENLVHEHQTVAASKPLNQSTRGFAPKTPGNNGPNAISNAKHTVRNKDDENVVPGTKKATVTRNALATPFAPRDRAPLGAKTTNAKATAFQTPAPTTGGRGQNKTQPRRSSTSRKPKLKIHQPETVEHGPASEGQGMEADEIEYCPPKITELPNFPSEPWEWGPDKTFPQFEGANLTRGWYEAYANPIGEDGLSRWEREDMEMEKKADQQVDRVLRQGIEESMRRNEDFINADIAEHNTGLSLSKAAEESRTHSALSKNGAAPLTIRSKSAAEALSQTSRVPSFAAPTAATKAKKSNPKLGLQPTIPRQTTGTQASRTTIGYAAGRKVSSSLKQHNQRVTPQEVEQKEENLDSRPTAEQDLHQLYLQGEDEDEDIDAMLFGPRDGRNDVFEEELQKALAMPALSFD